MLHGHGFGTACPLPAQACIPQGLQVFGGRPATPASSAARPALAIGDMPAEAKAEEAEKQKRQRKEAEEAPPRLGSRDLVGDMLNVTASNEKAANARAFLQANGADGIVEELRELLQAGRGRGRGHGRGRGRGRGVPKKKAEVPKAKAKAPAKVPLGKVAKSVAKAKTGGKKPAKWLREKPNGCSKCRHTPGCTASCWARAA